MNSLKRKFDLLEVDDFQLRHIERLSIMDNDIGEDTKENKKKKQTLNRLREQMEFYFSNSNLAKDKYLQKLLNGDHTNYVMVSEFMRFNRIKQISGDVRDLLKAIEESSVLELSDDRASVRRKTAAAPVPDQDSRTLYVENVPSTATVEWVLDVFGQYGAVQYVSMPKYKLSNRPKGFAFVELDSTESVSNALQEYFNIGHLISATRETPPLSFSLFGKEEDPSRAKDKEKKMGKKEAPPGKGEAAMEVQVEGSKVSHNSANNTEEKNEMEVADKGDDKAKSDTKENDKKRKVNGAPEGQPPAKIGKTQDAEKQEVLENNVPFNPNLARNQKKRQKKMEKINKLRDMKNLGLFIMTKKDWKRLRNKHIDMARQKEKQERKALKWQLHKVNLAKKKEEEGGGEKMETDEKAKLSQEEEMIAAKNAGAAYLDTSFGNNKEPEEVVLDEGLKYPRGVIVRIHTPAPIVSKKAFKRSVMSVAPVKYVNCQEGTSVAYVRCRTTEQAASFCANGQWMHMTILEDVEEAQYWQKNKRHHDPSSHHGRRKDGDEKRHKHHHRHHRHRHHHSKHKRYKDLDKPKEETSTVGPKLPDRSPQPEMVTLDDSEEEGECDIEKYILE